MYKRLTLACGLLLVLSLGGLYAVNRDAIDFKRAQNAFVTGGDEKAFHLAKRVYQNDITNDSHRKFFLDTIKRLGINYDAQEALLAFIDDGIYDLYQTQAIEYLHSLQENIIEKYSPNYIDFIPYNNKIIRWGETPIKVKIAKADKDIDLYFINEVERALMEWQNVVGNKFEFRFVDNNPDILIEFAEISDEEREKNIFNHYVVANTEPEFDENTLNKMTITLYTKNNKGQLFTRQETYNTALHEIAHALGIFGHSNNPQDVLYLTAIKTQENEYKEVSQSDINTMKLLYEIKPDITSGKAEYSIHPKIIFGSEDEINKTKFNEAHNYIKQAPSLPNGYIDLAQAAIFARDFDEAKTCLKKAIKYATDNNTKFIIYYNFAVICYETGDMNKALFYATKAREFRDKNSVTALMANIHYKKREYSKAIEQYEILVNNYPISIMYSVNLAKLYINRGKIITGIRVLNKLAENNPDAINDKRVKPFRLLMQVVK